MRVFIVGHYPRTCIWQGFGPRLARYLVFDFFFCGFLCSSLEFLSRCAQYSNKSDMAGCRQECPLQLINNGEHSCRELSTHSVIQGTWSQPTRKTLHPPSFVGKRSTSRDIHCVACKPSLRVGSSIARTVYIEFLLREGKKDRDCPQY